MSENCSVTLPGGLWDEGRLWRTAELRPITGALELRMLDGRATARNVPEFVSKTLALVVTFGGGAPIGMERARSLCIADRQVLMLHLARELSADSVWLHVTCAACRALFDVGYQRSRVPVQTAGKGYPFAEVTLRSCVVRVRVPNGADQEAAAMLEGEQAAAEMLRRCLVEATNGTPAELEGLRASLTPDEMALVDDAVEAIAPELATTISTRCAECGAPQHVELDPYDLGLQRTGLDLDLDDEVHLLAIHYHWSEREILRLPRARRRKYLRLIDRHRGASA